MERVYIAGTPSEAALVQAELNQAGIESELVGDHLYALRGVIPIESSTLPKVLVHTEDLDRARELIEAWQLRMSSDEVGEPWTCVCGETLEAQFKSCWSCGHSF